MIEEQWNFVGGYIPVDEEDWDGFFLSSNKMPYEIVVCYRVQNKDTKKIHAECTSRQKAKAQLRILEEAETKGGNIEAGLTGNYYHLHRHQTTFSIPQPFLTFSICPPKVAPSEVFPSNTSTAIGQPLAEHNKPKTI